MAATKIRECLQCGLECSADCGDFRDRGAGVLCPKCDDSLLLQSDGSVITRDIAHQHETVSRALGKMDDVLQKAWEGYTQAIRLIVGGGRIREAILGQLQYYLDQGAVRGFELESPNHGAILVRLR